MIVRPCSARQALFASKVQGASRTSAGLGLQKCRVTPNAHAGFKRLLLTLCNAGVPDSLAPNRPYGYGYRLSVGTKPTGAVAAPGLRPPLGLPLREFLSIPNTGPQWRSHVAKRYCLRLPVLRKTGLVRPCAEAKPYHLVNQNGQGRSPSLNQNALGRCHPLPLHATTNAARRAAWGPRRLRLPCGV
jgi:hypothetical protein